jgi:uncharacterized damage-inducible protein DinB
VTDRAFVGAFLEASRRYLSHEYPRKIEIAVGRLSSEDLWWRPSAGSNSVGNLVLHLAGNTRQWIVHGLGGANDTRRRAAEFARSDGLEAAELLAVLREATGDADRVLRDLDPAELMAERHIQGLAVTGLGAIYHVVEHFSMHTGQILYLAKLRSGQPLGLYDVDEAGRVTGTNW